MSRRAALEALYDLTVAELTAAITEKRASAAHLAQARNLLHDAGITADPQHPDKATNGLMKALAELDEEERTGMH